MRSTALAVATLPLLALAQQKGENVAEVHPSLPMTTCFANASCVVEDTSVTLDFNWRWLHGVGGYSNCYTGTDWNKQFCPDPVTCAKNCAVEGVDYEKTYLIHTDPTAKQMSLGYVAPGGNIGSRTYLMA